MNPKIEKLTTLVKMLRQRLSERVRKFARAHRQLFISIVILTAAVLAYLILWSLREPPAKFETVVLAPLVEVEQLEKQDIHVNILGIKAFEPEKAVKTIRALIGKGT